MGKTISVNEGGGADDQTANATTVKLPYSRHDITNESGRPRMTFNETAPFKDARTVMFTESADSVSRTHRETRNQMIIRESPDMAQSDQLDSMGALRTLAPAESKGEMKPNETGLQSLAKIKPVFTERPFEDKVAEVRRIRKKRRVQMIPHIAQASQA